MRLLQARLPLRILRPLMALLLSLLAAVSLRAGAVEVSFSKVTEGVYAFVGETGARSYDNEALNANIGLIVTPTGAVLIDSGATFQSAQKIHAAVKKITPQPVRWVINTGGQDHRWLGPVHTKTGDALACLPDGCAKGGAVK